MRRRVAAALRSLPDEGTPQERFLANLAGAPSAELLEFVNRPMADAAVLMPIVERRSGPALLLTARASHLKRHPGQVAFPGGRIEPEDAGPIDAALREAREEIGLQRADAQVAGQLGRLMTGTGFVVTPVVGFVDGRFEASPDPAEVEAVFEVPLAWLLDPANCRRSTRERFGVAWTTFEFDWDGRIIWGATAGMIVSLRNIITN